jgi:hypothetical protein
MSTMASRVTTTAATPDLSLHISPPSPATTTAAAGETQEAETRLLRLGLELDTAAQQWQGGGVHQVQQRLHQPSQTAHGFKKSSGGGGGGGGRRSARAPRMRWTTALHAHFVHAVELLGGHESMFNSTINTRLPMHMYLNSLMGLLILPFTADFLGVAQNDLPSVLRICRGLKKCS